MATKGFICQLVTNADVFKEVPGIIKKYELIPYDGSYKSYKKYHITLDSPKETSELDIEKKGLKTSTITFVEHYSNKIVCLLGSKYHVTIAEGDKDKIKQCLNENQNKFNNLLCTKLEFDEPVLIELPDKNKNKFEVTKEEAIKLNKNLAKYRKTPEEIRFPVDEEQIKKFYNYLTHNKNKIHKFQVFLPDRTTIGPIEIKNADELVKQCRKNNLKGLSCLSVNTIKSKGMKTYDVEEISNILFDVDVSKDRKVNGVSTGQDKKTAYETALKVKQKLEEELNLRVSLVDDSGNGYHLVIPVSIPLKNFFTGKNEDENKKIWEESEIRGRLVALENMLKEFDNDVCQIDCISKDIARRFKIAGSWNVKEGIAPDNYRQCSIIECNEEAITDAFVDGNTKVFDALEPTIKETVDVKELPVDKKLELDQVLKQDPIAFDLYQGDWEKHDTKQDGSKKDKWTRSEAEESLAVRLFKEGLSEDKVRMALSSAKIGKWDEAPKQYKNITIKKAKQFVQYRPNIPNIPNIPNNPNNPNIKEYSYLIKHFLEKKKIPFQNVGRGAHNGICYIGTYIEDDDGKTHTAVVTSDRNFYIDMVRRVGNEWKGINQIKNIFGLHYREEFYHDVLDSSWSNEIIKKWIFENYTVDIRNIYKRTVETIKKFMVYEDPKIYTMMALDILRSFFFFLFTSNSRTHHLAQPGSGKTNQTMLFRALMFHPIGSPDFSSASIYRTIEGTGATILIDDFDDLQDEEKARANRHIKVNYKKFKAIRSDGGRKFRPQGYDAYSHCVFNNVTGLDDSITQERVITYKLLKHTDAPDIEVDFKDDRFSELRDDLYICLLQYWKEIQATYNDLKVEELRARDLEIFKPQLAIAKAIDEDVFKEVLKFAKWYLHDIKMQDLGDDWEYLLLDHITKELDEKASTVEQEIEFSPNEIARVIADKLYLELKPRDFDKKRHQLRRFIGGKLGGYVLFKKTRPHNCVFYHVHMKGIKQILESRDMLGLFNDRLGLLGLLGMLGQNRQTTTLTQFDQKDDKTLDKEVLLSPNKTPINPPLLDRINELREYCKKVQEKGYTLTYVNLCYNFDESFIETCKEKKILIPLPKGDYDILSS